MKSFKSLLESNSTFRKIYTEEAIRFGKILKEYSADKIWNSMSDEDKREALQTAKVDASDSLVNVVWDDVPADVQDSINLFYYELAKDSREGQTMIRGVKNMVSENPDASKLVDKFLEKVKKSKLEDLNNIEAQKLNIAVGRFIMSKSPGNNATFDINPRDTPSGAPSKNRDWRGGMWTGD